MTYDVHDVDKVQPNETFARSLSHNNATPLVLIYLQEALKVHSLKKHELGDILAALHASFSELDLIYSDHNDHYEQWMFDLLLERKNLEIIRQLLIKEKADLKEVVGFVTKTLEDKQKEMEIAKQAHKASKDRVDQSLQNIDAAKQRRGINTGVALGVTVA